MQHHPIKKTPAAAHRDSPPAPAWPSYTATSQFVGTSPSGRVNVYVDPTLGQPAQRSAYLAAVCSRARTRPRRGCEQRCDNRRGEKVPPPSAS